MQQIGIEFKQKVITSLLDAKDQRGNADQTFLNLYGINKHICSKLVAGCTNDVMLDNEWFRLGRKLGVIQVDRKWNTARTDVFNDIEEDVLFCKEHAKAKIYVDDCGIGKTYTAKYLSKTLPNCFYVDASQGKSIKLFTETLAKALGISCSGKISEIKEDIKSYLMMIDKPIVIIDEAGDLSQVTLQEIKEFWNATEYYCGWYLIGAEGLKYILDKGMKNRRPGFREVFSRFSEKYTTSVPKGKEERNLFYRKLATDVLSANVTDTALLKEVITKCLVKDDNGRVSGLRRAESLLILHTETVN
jgi:hypothetical protein